MTKKTAFLFPGQGSQTIGMLAALAVDFPLVQTTFAEASAVLGYDLWQLVQNGPAEQLNQTCYTQPAILTASVAIYRVWLAQGGAKPAFMAGHGLGEYSALVCADALDLATAVRLVAARGRYMQEAVPAGAGMMAAIVGLEDQQVRAICAEVAGGEVVAAVNYNAIGQVVIAGATTAVERAMRAAEAANARLVMKLPVSVPSHCALMRPAAEQLAAQLETIKLQIPTCAIVNNVDVTVSFVPAAIKTALIQQLYSPVRWVEIIHYLVQQQTELFIECGPGKVLMGLNKRIDAQLTTLAINDLASLKTALGSV